MRNKRNKKGSKRSSKKSKQVKLPLVVDPKTKKSSLATTLFLLATLGSLAWIAYEIFVNGACWSWQ